MRNSPSLGVALWLLIQCVTSLAVFADERYEKPAYWLSHGYVEVRRPALRRGTKEVPQWKAHTLVWPVQFEDASHSLGNSMAEFQSYGDGPYYHGGCDLRVQARAEVHAPVAGRIEAGHYGYSMEADGSSTKFWHPWPEAGDSHYFEVAVITDDGYRFELHHMDERHLSGQILRFLQAGGGRAEAGALLGNTIAWPDGVYHHTHYNILTPSGVQLNPEYYSPLIEDTQAPSVSKVLASFKDGRTQEFGTGQFSESPAFFAVASVDRQNGNVYDHPPVLAGIVFEAGANFFWDFRERLAGSDGKFPPLWDFFIASIRGPGGESLETEGGYGAGNSVVRIPVPQDAHGKFQLRIGDQAGNTTRLEGLVLPAQGADSM